MWIGGRAVGRERTHESAYWKSKVSNLGLMSSGSFVFYKEGK